MKEQVFFLNMFPDYEPPEGWSSILSQAAVVAADIDPQQRRVDVAIHSQQYIPALVLEDVSSYVQQAYGLKTVTVTATHPADQLSCIEPEELMQLFVEENSMHRASLAGAVWTWEGECLTVQLLGNGVEQLQESARAVCGKLRQRFAVPVQIRFVAGAALEGKALFEAMEKMRFGMLNDLPVSSSLKALLSMENQSNCPPYPCRMSIWTWAP